MANWTSTLSWPRVSVHASNARKLAAEAIKAAEHAAEMAKSESGQWEALKREEVGR